METWGSTSLEDTMSFPGGLYAKESNCNAWDPGSEKIPGLDPWVREDT